jgi:hypothetical protein
VSKRKTAEAADVAGAESKPAADEAIVERILAARLKARDADESLADLTQKARSRIRKLDETLATRKQEAQSKALGAARSIDDSTHAADSSAQEADALVAEVMRVDASVRRRLRVLKILEVTPAKTPDNPQPLGNADPLPLLRKEVENVGSLWTQIENLTTKYSEDVALLEEEEAITSFCDEAWLAIVRAKSLGGVEMRTLYADMETLKKEAPEDIVNRVQHAAKMLVLIGEKGLLRSVENIRIAYYEEGRRARSWLRLFWRSRYIARCNLLMANYESFRKLIAEVSSAYGHLSNKWPGPAKTIWEQEGDVIKRLSQAQPDLLDWRAKGALPDPNLARALSSTGPTKRFCRQCGSPLKEGQKFCRKCGKAVS